MAVYQVAIIFEADTDEAAINLAGNLSMVTGDWSNDDVEEMKVSNAKIAFTKFEKEEDAGE